MKTQSSDEPHILIVDDEPANLTVMRAVLEPLGLVIVTANTANDALRRVLETDFAVILLDVAMPGIDGFETASIIRQRDRSRYVPIIFVTAGGADDFLLNQAYSAGAVDYLLKPFNPMVLRSKVGVFVELHKQRLQLMKQSETLRAVERERTAREIESVRNDLERTHLAELTAVLRRERQFLADVLSSVTEGKLHLCGSAQELPEPLSMVGRPISLQSRRALMRLRGRASEIAKSLNYPKTRLHDLVTAASEAAMNAIVHGDGGRAEVRADDKEGMIQIWVKDRGEGIPIDQLPRATLERGYSTKQTLGHGFWLMLNTVDRVSLLTARSGTTVVVQQNAAPPPPPDWKSAATAQT